MELFSHNQQSLMRSLNKFLRKAEIVTKENPLVVGSHVRFHGNWWGCKDEAEYTGFCIGGHKGSRGPALLVAFEDRELTHKLMPGRWYEPNVFGYVVAHKGNHKTPQEPVYAHIVDWQCILEVKNGEGDLLMMLTSDNPHIREIAKLLHEEKEDE